MRRRGNEKIGTASNSNRCWSRQKCPKLNPGGRAYHTSGMGVLAFDPRMGWWVCHNDCIAMVLRLSRGASRLLGTLSVIFAPSAQNSHRFFGCHSANKPQSSSTRTHARTHTNLPNPQNDELYSSHVIQPIPRAGI